MAVTHRGVSRHPGPSLIIPQAYYIVVCYFIVFAVEKCLQWEMAYILYLGEHRKNWDKSLVLEN